MNKIIPFEEPSRVFSSVIFRADGYYDTLAERVNAGMADIVEARTVSCERYGVIMRRRLYYEIGSKRINF